MSVLAARRSAIVDPRRAVALALPVVVPVAMTAAFSIAGDRLGRHGGYLAGFGLYWATCGALSVGLLGTDSLRRLFQDARPRLGRPAALGAALLLWPAVGAIATRLIPEIGAATPAMVVTIGFVGLANAISRSCSGAACTSRCGRAIRGWAGSGPQSASARGTLRPR